MTTDNTSAPTLREVVQKMTPLEKAVTVAHLDAGMECNGAETLDATLSDNMTFADVAEIAQRTGLTKKQVQGVIASLSSKGILSVGNEKPNGQPGVDQVLTDWGVTIAFDLLAEGIEAKATIKPAKGKKVEKTEPAPKPKKPARAPRGLEDRVLVEPGNAKDVKPTKEGSKRALLVTALSRGTTVEHLMDLLGWNRPTVTSAIYSDVKAIGLGVERREGKYTLLLPEGMKALPLREAAKRRAKAHEVSK
ncbi:MAG: hypothetical protein HC844_03650 [Tabrizicola sp.]|nr:hypothetical protein [Tabrizicola sp.]